MCDDMYLQPFVELDECDVLSPSQFGSAGAGGATCIRQMPTRTPTVLALAKVVVHMLGVKFPLDHPLIVPLGSTCRPSHVASCAYNSRGDRVTFAKLEGAMGSLNVTCQWFA